MKIRGEPPVPLSASDLREWNRLTREEVKAIDQNLLAQQILLLAMEFGQVEFGSSPADKMRKEISELLARFKKSDPYKILGVTEDAKVDVIKKAHLQLIKKYHPDRLPAGADKEMRAQCENLLAIVNEATDILMDPSKRENLDAEKALEKMGGRKAIEEQLQAELKYDEALLLLRRRMFRPAYEIFSAIEAKLKDNTAFQSDYVFCRFMVDQEAKIFQKADGPKILTTFEESLKKEPSNLWPLYYKAIVHKLLGETEQAIEAFETVLEKNPHHNEAASELRVLRMRQDKDKKPKGGSWFKKG